MNEKISSFEKELKESGKLIYTNVGISMLPLIRERRDVMVIETRAGAPKKLQAVLFRREGVEGRGKYVVHRILKVRKNGDCFIAGDHDYSGEIVKPEQILGVLTTVLRDGKPVKFSGVRYWCYLHLWCAPYPFRFFVLHVGRGIKAFFRAVRYKLTGK